MDRLWSIAIESTLALRYQGAAPDCPGHPVVSKSSRSLGEFIHKKFRARQQSFRSFFLWRLWQLSCPWGHLRGTWEGAMDSMDSLESVVGIGWVVSGFHVSTMVFVAWPSPPPSTTPAAPSAAVGSAGPGVWPRNRLRLPRNFIVKMCQNMCQMVKGLENSKYDIYIYNDIYIGHLPVWVKNEKCGKRLNERTWQIHYITKWFWKKCKFSMRDIYIGGFRALRLQVSTGTAKSQEASFGIDAVALSASHSHQRNDPLDPIGTWLSFEWVVGNAVWRYLLKTDCPENN